MWHKDVAEKRRRPRHPGEDRTFLTPPACLQQRIGHSSSVVALPGPQSDDVVHTAAGKSFSIGTECHTSNSCCVSDEWIV